MRRPACFAWKSHVKDASRTFCAQKGLVCSRSPDGGVAPESSWWLFWILDTPVLIILMRLVLNGSILLNIKAR